MPQYRQFPSDGIWRHAAPYSFHIAAHPIIEAPQIAKPSNQNVKFSKRGK